MRIAFAIIAGLGLAVAAGLWVASAPIRLSDAVIAQVDAASASPDLANGESVFHASGCASCHKAVGADGKALPVADGEKPVLAGGHELVTPFGTFVAPNITPDREHGIGGWSEAEFATAMLRGTAPDGSHYYPAFPYASYAGMAAKDVADLHAYMKTLPVSGEPSRAQQVSFPVSVRRGLGLWKRLNVSVEPVVETDDPVLQRGRYLVEVLGHCGECHTPRNVSGGLDRSRWMAGAEGAAGADGQRGTVPNITPHEEGLAGWSEADIAYALESGFTPEFDSLGGSMADVVTNTAKLSAADREAMAAYLKQAVAPHADAK